MERQTRCSCQTFGVDKALAGTTSHLTYEVAWRHVERVELGVIEVLLLFLSHYSPSLSSFGTSS